MHGFLASVSPSFMDCSHQSIFDAWIFRVGTSSMYGIFGSVSSGLLSFSHRLIFDSRIVRIGIFLIHGLFAAVNIRFIVCLRRQLLDSWIVCMGQSLIDSRKVEVASATGLWHFIGVRPPLRCYATRTSYTIVWGPRVTCLIVLLLIADRPVCSVSVH